MYEGRREVRKVKRIVITLRERKKEKALTTKLQGFVCL